MPFTFSHPAIVISFRKWFSLTGLIIGSMSPDFEYFLRMKIQSDFSHSHLGIFLFDLPLSILITFIVHNIIKVPFIEYSPYFIKSRINNLKDFNWNKYFVKNWLIVILSVITGAYSHLIWDSFTHETGFFVQKIHFLQSDILNIPVLKILQHSSTFLGGLFIFYCFISIQKQENISKKINLKFWIFVGIISFVLILFKIIFSKNTIAVGNLIVTLISSIFIALVLISMIYKNQKS